jgi:hypothetical protein
MNNHWQNTKHPWPCLMIVLPLLGFYEWCMVYEANAGVTPLRAGLDAWLGSALQHINWTLPYLPSLLIGFICVSWTVLKWDRSPPESLTTLLGMLLESVLFALALWALALVVAQQLSSLGIVTRSMRAVQLVGSGIYEEVLFRLLGYGLLVWLFKNVAQDRTAMIMALLVSSVGFAAAHYVGPQGEVWDWKTASFRTLAGLIFACLFQFRGLGIAVGTHAAYNLFVGLIRY